jgi:hypothetical protein
LAEVPTLVRQAQSIFTHPDWATLRLQARYEVWRTAPFNVPWFVAGHQPELFHPGVWVKNFALAGLARRVGGFALNLIVDNDTLKSTSVRFPVRDADGWPGLESERFDRWQGEAPWEERQFSDLGLFVNFGKRISERMAPWGIRPLIETFWPVVLDHDGTIGERFAHARRSLERQWGCNNVEVPLSRLCATRAFGRFVWALLESLPRFVKCHNDAVAAYRLRNKIKGHSHPVPDLAADGEWLELPLWGWQAGQQRRNRVFARQAGEGYELRAGQTFHLRSPDEWPSLQRVGFKVRSRALATTLFSRLFLADVFLHGIGGGKYDELTDELIRAFFRIEAPPFVVLSATRWLPLPDYPATRNDVRSLKAHLRALDYNPQRFLPGHPAEAERRALLTSPPATRRARRAWFAKLRQLLGPMREQLAQTRAEVVEKLWRAEREAEANAVLRRRDYSFVLYPESSLRPFLTAVQ